jgi:hypothetical protein
MSIDCCRETDSYVERMWKAVAEADAPSLRSIALLNHRWTAKRFAFEVRHTQPDKAPGWLTRSLETYAVYRVFEDERDGKALQPALDVLAYFQEVTLLRNVSVIRFLTQDAHWHAYGEHPSGDLDTHFRCLDVYLGADPYVFEIRARRYAGLFARQHDWSVWLQGLVRHPRVLHSESCVFNLIRDCIHRQDHPDILAFLLRSLQPTTHAGYRYYDTDVVEFDHYATRPLYAANDSRHETLLHVFARSTAPDCERLRLLHDAQHPYALDSAGKLPSELLDPASACWALMRATEDQHAPWQREVVLLLGMKEGSGSPLSMLSVDLLRMIVEMRGGS